MVSLLTDATNQVAWFGAGKCVFGEQLVVEQRRRSGHCLRGSGCLRCILVLQFGKEVVHFFEIQADY